MAKFIAMLLLGMLLQRGAVEVAMYSQASRCMHANVCDGRKTWYETALTWQPNLWEFAWLHHFGRL